MNQNIKDNLIKFGLTDSESRVYYSALVLENSSADQISKHSKLNRTSCYSILERLIDLGLVSRAKKKGKTIFKSVSPDRLLEIVEERKRGIEQIIPDLKSLFEISKGNPDVKFYEGKEGLKTVLNIITKEAKDVLIFGDGDSFKKVMPNWTDYYKSKRITKNIKAKVLLKATSNTIKSAKKLKLSKGEKGQLTKIRLLPASYDIEYCGFDVFNNKTVLYSFEKQDVAVVIESKIISKMMRTVYGILWEVAEKYDKTILNG